MTRGNIIPVKYVFLDIVAYTKRSIEAQCDITRMLNRIVKGILDEYNIGRSSVIYIPTGDGICIALIDATLPYDIHVTIAKDILSAIWAYSHSQEDNSRKFEVRIGINQSEDNLVRDINGRVNVTGVGINNARRIMDLADGSQILVSRAVYEVLHPREKYPNAFVKFTAPVKHGLVLDVYQLFQVSASGLNVKPPSSFVSPPTLEPKLTKLAAYYFAHAIKNERFILNKARESVGYNDNWLKLLLWFLAKDSEKASETTSRDVYVGRVMPDTSSNTMEGQFEWFLNNVPAEVAIDLSYVVVDNAVSPSIQHKYFEDMSDNLVVNSKGREKLKRDWPEIWNEFGLGELSG